MSSVSGLNEHARPRIASSRHPAPSLSPRGTASSPRVPPLHVQKRVADGRGAGHAAAVARVAPAEPVARVLEAHADVDARPRPHRQRGRVPARHLRRAVSPPRRPGAQTPAAADTRTRAGHRIGRAAAGGAAGRVRRGRGGPREHPVAADGQPADEQAGGLANGPRGGQVPGEGGVRGDGGGGRAGGGGAARRGAAGRGSGQTGAAGPAAGQVPGRAGRPQRRHGRPPQPLLVRHPRPLARAVLAAPDGVPPRQRRPAPRGFGAQAPGVLGPGRPSAARPRFPHAAPDPDRPRALRRRRALAREGGGQKGHGEDAVLLGGEAPRKRVRAGDTRPRGAVLLGVPRFDGRRGGRQRGRLSLPRPVGAARRRGRLLLVPQPASRRHPGQLHVRAAGYPARHRAAARAGGADRRPVGGAPQERGGRVRAVCVQVDELPADEGGAAGVHRADVGHLFVRTRRVLRVPPLRLRRVPRQVERAPACHGLPGRRRVPAAPAHRGLDGAGRGAPAERGVHVEEPVPGVAVAPAGGVLAAGRLPGGCRAAVVSSVFGAQAGA